MINALLQLIINIVLNILSFFINIILLPITAIINTLFPNINSYFHYFYTFLNDYVIQGIRFMREVFYNLTGVNRELMGIIFAMPLIWFTFMLANNSIRLIVSLYRLYKTGKDN